MATRADLLARYRKRVDVSKRWRKDEAYDALWSRLSDMYSGKQFAQLKREDQIAVNVAFATVNVIFPSISVNHPKTTVMARDPEDADRAIITEAILDYWWKNGHWALRDEFRRAVKDFIIFGHGWVKCGYKYKTVPQERSQDDIMSEFADQREQADQYAMANPDMAGSLPTDDEILNAVPAFTQAVVDDRPFVERIAPQDIYVDPEATSDADMCWIAQRIVRPLEDVKNDERYSRSVRMKLSGDATLNEKWLDEKKRRGSYGDDIQRVTVWEFYDLKANTMSVFANGGDKFLVEPTRMPYRFGHPFVMLRNYDVPSQFYPMGDLEAIEPLQSELNKTRSQLMNARKQFARKHLFIESAFSAQGRAALTSDTDGEMVPVNDDGNHKLSDVIMPLPTNTMPAELFNYSQVIETDIDTVSGVSDYQRGSAPETRRTATEASMIQDAVNARSADKLAIIENVLANIGSNLVCLARQYMTGDQVARIVGKAGQPIWVPYTQDDLDFEADFEVEGGSTQPKNEAWRQQQATQMMQMMAPMVQAGVVNPAELARFVLQSFGVKNPEQFLQQPPPPMMDPNADPNAPQGGPPMMDPSTAPPPGVASPLGPAGGQGGMPPGAPPQIDPAILAQLAGQVGLHDPHIG